MNAKGLNFPLIATNLLFKENVILFPRHSEQGINCGQGLWTVDWHNSLCALIIKKKTKKKNKKKVRRRRKREHYVEIIPRLFKVIVSKIASNYARMKMV